MLLVVANRRRQGVVSALANGLVAGPRPLTLERDNAERCIIAPPRLAILA